MKLTPPTIRFRVDGLHDSDAWHAALVAAGTNGQIENELERLAEQENVSDAMIDAPKLKINVPESLTTKWAGCDKYYGTRYRFDEFIGHCMELSDEELFKVFDYTYENYQPHVHFPVSI